MPSAQDQQALACQHEVLTHGAPLLRMHDKGLTICPTIRAVLEQSGVA